MNTFPNAIVREVTGTPLATLQRYLDRGHITLQPCDVQSGGSGQRRGFSPRRIFQIAIVKEIIGLGVSPSRASKAAFAFTDQSSPGRDVGEVFPLGTTYLVGLPRGENRVVCVPPDLSIADVLSNDPAAFIININNVIAKVTEKLDNK